MNYFLKSFISSLNREGGCVKITVLQWSTRGGTQEQQIRWVSQSGFELNPGGLAQFGGFKDLVWGSTMQQDAGPDLSTSNVRGGLQELIKILGWEYRSRCDFGVRRTHNVNFNRKRFWVFLPKNIRSRELCSCRGFTVWLIFSLYTIIILMMRQIDLNIQLPFCSNSISIIPLRRFPSFSPSYYWRV